MLRASDVTVGYRSLAAPVLRGVSMEVPAGGFVGLLGPNGSGKTTLLRCLAGTLSPSNGRVTLDGQDLSQLSRRAVARRMAVVPQETRLAFDFTALEVVLMGRYPHLGAFEVEGAADLAIAREALAATGTRELEDRTFNTLSGGEKQRVIIAAALAQLHHSEPRTPDPGSRTPDPGSRTLDPDPRTPDPDSILLLDEPTAALDLAYQLEVAALLRDLQRQMPIAILVSTHDLNFAAGLCSSLVLLREGRVLAAGPTAEVLTPDRIRVLYGVEADVRPHEAAGHLVVVPVRRVAP
jgi:iron complex transport system ATP-binding protein